MPDTCTQCAKLNYEEGVGLGLSCVWFDYNASGKRCRCYGAVPMMGDTTSESGTDAYITNKECDSLYRKTCDGCGFDIWVAEEGSSWCFPGWSSWNCISCPLFQSAADVDSAPKLDIVGHGAGRNSDGFDDEVWDSPNAPQGVAENAGGADDTVVVVKVSPWAATAMLACAMVLLGVLAFWRFGCCGDKRYAKVSYASDVDTEVEENVIFNGGDEEL